MLRKQAVGRQLLRGYQRLLATARYQGGLPGDRPPGHVGQALEDVETPALLLDLDAFERNVASLKHRLAALPHINVRPHAKAHKCPEVAALQLRLLGATGVCAQKVAEAEALVAGGLTDILLSNEVVSPAKLARLAAPARGAPAPPAAEAAGSGADAPAPAISLCIDDPSAATAASQAAREAGVRLGALVEVNVGQDRCGVDSPQEASDLALHIAALPGLEFRGVQAYHGGLQHVRSPQDRRDKVSRVVEKAAAAVEAVEGAGLRCHVVTGGGSGSYWIEASSGVYNEIQPGSFAFGDVDYAKNVQEDGRVGEWEQSLWVWTQVMSRNTKRRLAVVDAGLKAVSLDSGPPVVPPSAVGGCPVEFKSGGDEHGLLLWPQIWQESPEIPGLGHKLRLVPGHCDPTVNLYDWLVAFRGNTVQHVWRIAGRGPGL